MAATLPSDDWTQEFSFPAGCRLSRIVAHVEGIFGVLHDAFEYLGLYRDGRNESVYLSQPRKNPNRPAAYINMKPYKIGDLALM